MAVVVCNRFAGAYEEGLAIPEVFREFFNLGYGKCMNPLHFCPAASNYAYAPILAAGPVVWEKTHAFVKAAWKASGIETAPPIENASLIGIMMALFAQQEHLRRQGARMPDESEAEAARVLREMDTKKEGVSSVPPPSATTTAVPASTTAAPDLQGDKPMRRGRPKRGEFKVTQAKAAAMFGVSVETIQRWDRGENAPPGYSSELRKDEAALLRYAATHSSESAERARAWKRIKAMGGYDENRSLED